ncbi:MAG: pyrroline-5-carboxylate reductase [Nitrospiraceae bacterium]|jgi:pyrroline-5-carboxylate reductase|nr:pyrroline-5-carboxylate reductase [Nitrospira sp.]MDW7648230.1 pyrroline-5-carboxylate reductase [Nitrospiraceae bacterium]MBP0121864.1 pyrroline-5-carboxylate reductase [Nitrospira sp.]MBP0125083.1 pyrroline-5-carboxylate reductase [Nitrospira sp.]MBP0127941.1 pyrroline-5-carboxylate reductase [Nitrospira sp.]
MSNPTITNKIAFIGGGQMAEALIGGLLAGRLCPAESIWVTDPVAARGDHLKSQFGVRVGSANREAIAWANVVVLAVKPQTLPAVLSEVGPALAQSLVVSIVAGVTIKTIAEQMGGAMRVVRAMPNTPALVREGMTALALGSGVSEEDSRLARTVFEAVGRVVLVEERLMDAVTGLSGSGPAYVFLAIEALADGGVQMGLPRQTAELLAAQTVLGAAQLVLESGVHPAQLKDRVASPGGTTIAGLYQLEQGSFRATLMAAVEAATMRSKELGR